MSQSKSKESSGSYMPTGAKKLTLDEYESLMNQLYEEDPKLLDIPRDCKIVIYLRCQVWPDYIIWRMDP